MISLGTLVSLELTSWNLLIQTGVLILQSIHFIMYTICYDWSHDRRVKDSIWQHVVTCCLPLQVSEVEVNGQIEAVCESVFSEMESQAVDALDLPGSGCFRMRSHSYVRAIEKGCSQEEEEERAARQAITPPRTTTTVRTIQSSTGTSTLKAVKTSVITEGLFMLIRVNDILQIFCVWRWIFFKCSEIHTYTDLNAPLLWWTCFQFLY